MSTGFVASGFEKVRDAFEADPRGGSAQAVIQHGQTIVDLREGWRDAARTVPWDENTLVNVYSVGKPVIALALLMLIELGPVALDDPTRRVDGRPPARFVAEEIARPYRADFGFGLGPTDIAYVTRRLGDFTTVGRVEQALAESVAQSVAES